MCRSVDLFFSKQKQIINNLLLLWSDSVVFYHLSVWIHIYYNVKTIDNFSYDINIVYNKLLNSSHIDIIVMMLDLSTTFIMLIYIFMYIFLLNKSVNEILGPTVECRTYVVSFFLGPVSWMNLQLRIYVYSRFRTQCFFLKHTMHYSV